MTKKIILMFLFLFLFSYFNIFSYASVEEYRERKAETIEIIKKSHKDISDDLNKLSFFHSIGWEYRFISQSEPPKTYVVKNKDNSVSEIQHYVYPDETQIAITEDDKYLYMHDGTDFIEVIYPPNYDFSDKYDKDLRYSANYRPLLYIVNTKTWEVETRNLLEKNIQCDAHLHIVTLNRYGKVLLGCGHPRKASPTQFYLYDIGTENIDKLGEIDLYFDGFWGATISSNSEVFYYKDHLYNLKTGSLISGFSYSLPLGTDRVVQFTGDRNYKVKSLRKKDYGEYEEFSLPEDLNLVFSDILMNFSSYEKTKLAHSQGWLTGYPDGTLKPLEPVKRVEFAKMLMQAFKKGEAPENFLEKFTDVQKGEWYMPFLAKAVEIGTMNGYGDGTIRPANKISLAESVKMVLEIKYPEKNLSQVNDDQAWYINYIDFSRYTYPDLDFLQKDPEYKMTRGECVELISAVL
jgi:hypothetical protein